MVNEIGNSNRCCRFMEKALPATGYVAGIMALASSCLGSYSGVVTAQSGQEIAYKIGAFCYLDPDGYSCHQLRAALEATNQAAQQIFINTALTTTVGALALTGVVLYSCLRTRN
jgi:hypothetical protein